MKFYAFLDTLLDGGEENLVSSYIIEVSANLMFKGYDFEDILEMDMSTLTKELRKPESPYGWNTVWGKHIVCG